jgi:hypothetical protein
MLKFPIPADLTLTPLFKLPSPYLAYGELLAGWAIEKNAHPLKRMNIISVIGLFSVV